MRKKPYSCKESIQLRSTIADHGACVRQHGVRMLPLRQLRVIVQELEDKREDKVHLTTPRPFTAPDWSRAHLDPARHNVEAKKKTAVPHLSSSLRKAMDLQLTEAQEASLTHLFYHNSVIHMSPKQRIANVPSHHQIVVKHCYSLLSCAIVPCRCWIPFP